VEEGPLPPLGGKVILLVWIWDQGIVGGHHGNIEMDEILKERRSVGTRVAGRNCVMSVVIFRNVAMRLTLLIPVALNVPVRVDISGLVLFDTGSLNLFETPLRQVDISSTEVASEIHMLQPESGCQGADLRIIPRGSIPHNFDLPVILGITHSSISIARDFPVSLGNGSGDLMRMKVTASLSMNQTNDITISGEAEGLFRLVVGFMAVGVEEPVIVSIFVVIASDLLLS